MDLFEQTNMLVDYRRKRIEKMMDTNPGFFNKAVMEYLKEYDASFRNHLEEFACAYLTHTTLYPDQVEMVVEEGPSLFGFADEAFRLRYWIYFRKREDLAEKTRGIMKPINLKGDYNVTRLVQKRKSCGTE